MHSRMLAVLDEGDSVEFGDGGEGQDFAIRPIKRKIHKGVRGEIGRGRVRAGRQDDSPSTFETGRYYSPIQSRQRSQRHKNGDKTKSKIC